MAFTITKDVQEGHGFGLKITTGTYASGNSFTGGAIVTGLNYVVALFLQPNGSAVSGTQSVIDSSTQSMPCSTGSVTIITPANETGLWMALGE